MPDSPSLIVVVDDEPLIRDLLRRRLAKEGYEVEAFPDAESALPVIRARRPDLLLTDIRMPGLDGFDLLKRARAFDRDLPVVLLTAYASVDATVRAFRGEVDGFIEKPFSFDEVRRVARRLVDARRHERELRELVAERAVTVRELQQNRDRLTNSVLSARTDLEAANARLARRLNDFEILREIAEFTTPVSEPSALSTLICPLVRDKMSVETVAVLVRDDPTAPPRIEAAVGLPASLADGVRLDGAEALLAAERHDAEASARVRALFGGGELLATAIAAAHGPPALLVVARRPDQPGFRSEDRELLGLVAHDLALNLENSRLLRRTEDEYLEVLRSLVTATECRHAYLTGHSQRVGERAAALSLALGLPAREREVVHHGAIVHDLGKIGVRDATLDKPGALDGEEWQEIHRHPTIGEEIARPSRHLTLARPVIRHHHERWDGRGYPDGLAGDAIPLAAQIVSVCDAWDAMTCPRPYRATLDPAEALSRLRAAAGTQFDPFLVEAFCDSPATPAGREEEK